MCGNGVVMQTVVVVDRLELRYNGVIGASGLVRDRFRALSKADPDRACQDRTVITMARICHVAQAMLGSPLYDRTDWQHIGRQFMVWRVL